MSFNEKFEQIKNDNTSSKKVFNEQVFNKVASAILNDPSYEEEVIVTKDGQIEKKTIKPVEDLRKGIITGIAKAAGVDSAETAKLVDEHQFSEKLPWHGYMASTLEKYMSLGKPVPLHKKEDMNASIFIEPQEECVKEVSAPGSTDKKRVRYGAYRKVKVSSNCPNNLRTPAE